MNFESALKAMREGKKVRRKLWIEKLGKHDCFYILDRELMYFTGIKSIPWNVSCEELLAEDWEFVDA